MLLRFLVISFLFLALKANAQDIVTKSNASKSILKQFEKAQKCIQKKERAEAIKKLENIIDREPSFIDAHLLLGGQYYESNTFSKAINQFSRVLEIDSNYNFRVYQALAQSYEANGDFEDAASFYIKYLAKSPKIRAEDRLKINRKVADFEFRVQALRNPVPFDPVPLSPNINSKEYSEYLPSLTADGQRIFFTRVVAAQEDIFFSEKDSLGDWLPAQSLPNLNTLNNEGAHAISADGKTILFTYCSDGRTSNIRGCNIYASFLRNGQWTSPAFFDALNSKAWDSQPTISADGQTIIFTSKRPGGKGQSDLWWSRRNGEGKWEIPTNLGGTINTPQREESPFLHPDGKTLYFKSDGHPGMGSFDLFRSELQEDGSWTTPVNLGYPINTEAHEGSMIVRLDGKTALYSRSDASVNFDQKLSDIYSFTLPEDVQASPVGFVAIRVFDAITKVPLVAEIGLQSNAGDIYRLETDSEGEIIVTLPTGKNYSLAIDKENYVFHSERFELDSIYLSDAAFSVDVYLKSIEKVEIDQPVVLKNVLFETGSFELMQESHFELDRLVALLNNSLHLKIEIRGHTDNIGEAEENQILSENRAMAVRDYLVSKGIEEERIKYIGFGESIPLKPNDTALGRKENRRTEFVIKKEWDEEEGQR